MPPALVLTLPPTVEVFSPGSGGYISPRESASAARSRSSTPGSMVTVRFFMS